MLPKFVFVFFRPAQSYYYLCRCNHCSYEVPKTSAILQAVRLSSPSRNQQYLSVLNSKSPLYLKTPPQIAEHGVTSISSSGYGHGGIRVDNSSRCSTYGTNSNWNLSSTHDHSVTWRAKSLGSPRKLTQSRCSQRWTALYNLGLTALSDMVNGRRTACQKQIHPNSYPRLSSRKT